MSPPRLRGRQRSACPRALADRVHRPEARRRKGREHQRMLGDALGDALAAPQPGRDELPGVAAVDLRARGRRSRGGCRTASAAPRPARPRWRLAHDLARRRVRLTCAPRSRTGCGTARPLDPAFVAIAGLGVVEPRDDSRAARSSKARPMRHPRRPGPGASAGPRVRRRRTCTSRSEPARRRHSARRIPGTPPIAPACISPRTAPPRNRAPAVHAPPAGSARRLDRLDERDVRGRRLRHQRAAHHGPPSEALRPRKQRIPCSHIRLIQLVCA